MGLENSNKFASARLSSVISAGLLILYYVITTEKQNVNLTLLRYHEKSYVNSTMWLILTPLKNEITVYYNYFFSPYNILQHGLYTHIDKQTRLCLGTFEYIKADREIYKKCITKSEEYSTTRHA
jgi:hypothetical protein